MSEQELYTLLSSIVVVEQPRATMNVAYDHFDSKVMPPFILYRNTDSDTFKADDKVFFKDNRYIVDLVTDIKNTELEAKIETLFDTNNIPYDKEEDYIADERIFQIRYLI